MTEGPQDHRLNIKVFPLYLFLLGADIKTGQDTTHCVTVRCQTMAERYLVRMIMCYYTVHLVGNVRIFISCTRNTKKKRISLYGLRRNSSMEETFFLWDSV